MRVAFIIVFITVIVIGTIYCFCLEVENNNLKKENEQLKSINKDEYIESQKKLINNQRILLSYYEMKARENEEDDM